jgi:GNAT superfamily N-acetyltransferase
LIPIPALTVETLRPGMDSEFRGLFAIYQAALPESERKNETVLRTMLERPDYEFRVARLGAAVVGFSIVISFTQAGACLLEYMAVVASERGKGIGGRLLQSAASGIDSKYLLMEIDAEKPGAPDSDQSVRRRKFYRRLGCREISGLAYRMPPVSASTPPAMSLFVYRDPLPPVIDRSQLQLWLECVYTDVYGRSREDFRIGEMLSGLPQKIELV